MLCKILCVYLKVNEWSVRGPGYFSMEREKRALFLSHIVSLKTINGMIHRSFSGKVRIV